jgi:ribosomal protein L40E
LLLLGEVFLVVYCQKCGAENADEADFCKKCGAPLAPVKRHWRERVGKRAEEECFGVTGGGAIFGILFGIVVVVLGLALVYQVPIWIVIGPIVAIVIGVILILFALNAIRRKRLASKEGS